MQGLILAAGMGSRLKKLTENNTKSIDVYKRQAKVFCVVDDDARLVKKYINGVPIEGTREDIPDLANKYDINKIILAIPSAPKRVQKERCV